MDDARAVALIVAAGSGTRLGGEMPKALLTIGRQPLVTVATAHALAAPSITSAVVAAPPGFETEVREAVAPFGDAIAVVTGGSTRQRSVAAGLDAVNALDPGVRIVAVHDAARPFASPDLFTTVVEAVFAGADAAVPVVRLVDTVKRVREGSVIGTEPRDELALAQTPQACRIGLLRESLAKAEASELDFTDESGLLEWAGVSVRTVEGEPDNFKITTAADLARADVIAGARRD